MKLSRVRAGLVSAAATAGLVAGIAAPVLAAEPPDAPTVVSAELVSADGNGCDQPAVALSDDWLDVLAQTGGDSSLRLDAQGAAGQQSVETECVLQVHIRLDQPASVRPSQYLLSGSVNTFPGTASGHWFESSFDSATWYGQRNSTPAGSAGPFHQGGGSRLDQGSACGTDLDLSIRVGLSLTSAGGLAAADSVSLDAPRGAELQLVTVPGACA
jgi:hypothetical protein